MDGTGRRVPHGLMAGFSPDGCGQQRLHGALSGPDRPAEAGAAVRCPEYPCPEHSWFLLRANSRQWPGETASCRRRDRRHDVAAGSKTI